MTTLVKLNSAAVRALLQSAAVQADLDARASRIASAAGPGMETSSNTTPTRARATVITATHEARLAESRDRKLLRALDAGR